MRKRTLAITFVVVYFAIWNFLTTLFTPWNFGLTFWQVMVLGLLASFLLSFAIHFVLLQIHKRLLPWRKAQGRDIEDEERYESDLIDHGMISLSPRQEEGSEK
ncbi:MAG: hypothetical protein ABJB40_14570 [Acidobacteriota bacterium]